MSKILMQGLSEKQARLALFRFGKNQLNNKKKISATLQFVRYFKNPLVLILLVAAALSSLFGEVKSSVLIVVMVLFSTLLNFFQERKSGRAAEKLQEKLSLTATVVRGGVKKDIKAEYVVPGDLVFLSAGDVAPADGLLVEGESLFVNEAALTGESFPVEKIAVENGSGQVPEAKVRAGTNVVSGSGYCQVTATGSRTEFGKIASSLDEASQPVAFEKGINSFGYLVLRFTAFIVIAVFFISVFKPFFFGAAPNRSDIVEAFLFALAIAVGLTPELLPMIMSLNMAKGSLRMSKKGVVVKRLNAIPDFGSIDILCTDKTGTLTEDIITLVKYIDVDGKLSEPVLHFAYVNSLFQSGLRNPLDAAILNFKHLSAQGYRKVQEIPYDFYRRRISVIAHHEGKDFLVTKGQPEEIFKISSHYLRNEETKKFTPAFLKKINALYGSLSRDGYKTLAVAIRLLPDRKEKYNTKDERDLTLVGLVGFYDPPKATAAETVKELAAYGVEVKIITGDNELVTKRICGELKLPVRGLMTSEDLDKLDQAALAKKALETTIFARFTPEQKRRVIACLRGSGRVVGYLGDGINDAPSLKAADIGISVSNAADVAKESADIILSHKSLRELGDGIIEGRKTYGNTLKYLMMGISSNFGNMFSLIGAAIALPFLPILPYQVLLGNTLYDLSQTSIPSDNVDAEYLEKPKHWDIAFIKKFMIVFGLLSSVFDLATFYLLYRVFHLPAASFQTGWFVESVVTQTLVIFSIRTRKFIFHSRPSPFLAATALVVAFIAFALPFTFLGKSFNFQPLPLSVIAVIILVVIAYLTMVEIAKHFFYKKRVI